MFNNIKTTLYQRWNSTETTWKVEKTIKSTLFQREKLTFILTLTLTLCNIVNSNVGFYFIFKVESNFLQSWSTTVKQHSSEIEMLAGKEIEKSSQRYSIKKLFSYDSWQVLCRTVILWNSYEWLLLKEDFLKAKLTENDPTVIGKFGILLCYFWRSFNFYMWSRNFFFLRDLEHDII